MVAISFISVMLNIRNKYRVRNRSCFGGGVPRKSIKVAVVNADSEILTGICGVVSLCGYSVVFSATECGRLSDFLLQNSVDLIITDLPGGQKTFFAALDRWLELYPAIPKIVYASDADLDYLKRAQLMGVKVFIQKKDALESFISFVRQHLDRKIKHLLCQECKVIDSSDEALSDLRFASLGCRELEIFELLGNGFSRKEIAEKLSLRPRTVDSYLARLKSAMGISSCRELVRKALAKNGHAK